MTDIREILDVIVQLNINRCVSTTHDMSTAECARIEIVRGLADHYNIDYMIKTKSQPVFPVPKGSNAKGV
jgi:hypothetical protein